MGYLDADSRPALAEVDVPVYAAWGEDDPVVPVNVAVQRVRSATTAPLVLRVVPGAGHGLPPDSGWLTPLAAWIGDPGRGRPAITGVEPWTAHGVSAVPRTSAVHHPAVQVGLSATVALLVVGRLRRARHDDGPAARAAGPLRTGVR